MDEKDIGLRIGTFFIVMGAGSVLIFVISDMAETVYFDYLFLGLLLVGFGLYLRRGAEKPPSSGRFEWWKNRKNKDKKEENED